MRPLVRVSVGLAAEKATVAPEMTMGHVVPVVRRFMTLPGVGPITALAFMATIDDPARFARSRSVGAYVGLTSRRHASGEVDGTGRIAKCG